MPRMLKFYEKEDRAYQDLLAMALTREEVALLLGILCRARGMEPPELNFDLKSWSFYRPAGEGDVECISIASHMLNVLTVIHETAHCIHVREYKTRLSAASQRGELIPRERSHGRVFQGIVKGLASLVRRRLAESAMVNQT